MTNTHLARSFRRHPLTQCLLAALAVGGFAESALAVGPERTHSSPTTTLPVTSCADDGTAGTLRSVIAGASSGDTVDLTQLACSTITLTAGQIDVPLDDLAINGPGQDVLSVDGNESGRVIRHTGIGTLTVSALTISGGYYYSQSSAYGGCVFSDGSVSLVDSTVSACTAVSRGFFVNANGGGVNARDMNLLRSTVSNCQVVADADFIAFANGGGIFSRYGSITLTDSVIIGNRAEVTYTNNPTSNQASGGGIAAYFGATITGSTISNNFAGCDTVTQLCRGAIGGGIRAIGIGTNGLTMSSSVVSDNVAEGRSVVNGGGVNLTGDWNITSIISNSTISGNSARGTSPLRRGGGLLIDQGAVHISGSMIDHNTAAVGGGIFVGGEASVANTTISGNIVSDVGGAILVPYSPYVSLKLHSSTVTSNNSTGNDGGAGIVNQHDPKAAPTEFQSSIIAGNVNSIEGSPYAADVASTNAVFIGANNLIVEASGVTLPPDTLSADPILGPLQDNGGLTWTHALLPGSPAIDAGNNAANLDFDQRGEGYSRVSGSAADIGAFEVQQGPVGSPPKAADDNYTTVENTALIVATPGVLDNDSDPDGDPLTVAPVSGPSNGTITLNPDGSFTYTPNDDFVGTDSFTYEANDGQLDSNVATVTITVKQDPADMVFADGFDSP